MIGLTMTYELLYIEYESWSVQKFALGSFLSRVFFSVGEVTMNHHLIILYESSIVTDQVNNFKN